MALKIINQQAVNVATLVERMVSQYFCHVAAMHVARDPRAKKLGPQVEPEQIVPVLKIPRGDGNTMVMWFDHFLAEERKPETREDFDRVWLIGALLVVADPLDTNRYFGHEPEAEIIRHLRNGVAHGNRFKFDRGAIDKATGTLKHPANISRYAARQAMPMRDVDTHLRGTEVLFGWGGGPGAVLDCLTVLGIHLWHLGYGMPIP